MALVLLGEGGKWHIRLAKVTHAQKRGEVPLRRVYLEAVAPPTASGRPFHLLDVWCRYTNWVGES